MKMALHRTPLYELCLSEGGRLGPFSGWEMPIQFSGLVKEHQSVRKNVGLFDISHMGILHLSGSNPKKAIQNLVPTDLDRIGPGEACYTVLLNEAGGIIDDLIIYEMENDNQGNGNLILIINAGRTSIDISWLNKHLQKSSLCDFQKKNNHVLIALQGPNSEVVLENYVGKGIHTLPKFGHRRMKLKDTNNHQSDSPIVARTGYTGEDGFEILVNIEQGRELWESFIKEGVMPCGLGARDTLRLEAAMPLYGNDIDETTSPFEAGLGWLVHLEMQANFIGRKALEQEAKEGRSRALVGLKINGRAIGRKGNEVIHSNQSVGKITSGTWSPTLNQAIAMAYVPTPLSKIGTTLEVEIRGKRNKAEIIRKPFYRRN